MYVITQSASMMDKVHEVASDFDVTDLFTTSISTLKSLILIRFVYTHCQELGVRLITIDSQFG